MGASFERTLIVGSGPSVAALKKRDFLHARESGVHILAVNRARTCGTMHSWFTLDPDDRVLPLLDATEQTPGVTYYAAVPRGYGTKGARLRHHRQKPTGKVCYYERVSGRGEYGSAYGLCPETGHIHGGNSMWGALQLAVQKCARHVALVGLDATNDPYAHGGDTPKRDMGHLPALFASAVVQLRQAGVKVVNGSKRSRVDCFDRCHPVEAIEWITKLLPND